MKSGGKVRMFRGLRMGLVGGALLTLPLIAVAPTGADAETVAPRPSVIPAFQQWSPSTGGFELRSDAEIAIEPGDEAVLERTAQILADDLGTATGHTPDVRVGAPRTGDIELALDPTSGGTGGYRLEIGPTLRVEGNQDEGVFYGTRSVVQLLRQDTSIPAGTAADWPRYPERGFMIDLGRHFFSPAFLRTQIREMSYLKLNLLHLHLSDDLGFRIESDRHPEIVSPEHLTKAEVTSLVEYAADRHITVVPEIDMPGHMTSMLAAHPEHQLANALGSKEPSRLDVASPAARAYALDILEEYLPLFPGRYWHIGGDEYMPSAEYLLHPKLAKYAKAQWGKTANGKDTFLDFLNSVNAFLRSHGKVSRVWNDDLGGGRTVALDPSVVVEWWTDFSPLSDPFPKPPQYYLDRGHQVLNNGWWPTYDATAGLPPPDMGEAYVEWDVHNFYGTLYLNSTIQLPPHPVSPDEPDNLGAKLALWMDGRTGTDAEIAAGVLPRLRVIAQKTWESPLPGDYATFLQIAAAVGQAP